MNLLMEAFFIHITPIIWADDIFRGNDNVGVNGIRYYKGAIYVSNSDAGTIIKIDVPEGDDCGQGINPRIYANIGAGCDEFTFDTEGRIICALWYQNKVVRWTSDDHIETVADMSDYFMDIPTSVAFGRVGENRNQLYILNSASPGAFDAAKESPSIIRVELDTMGDPSIH